MEAKKKAWLSGDWQNDRVIDSDFWFMQTEHLWNFLTSVRFYDTESDCWRKLLSSNTCKATKYNFKLHM